MNRLQHGTRHFNSGEVQCVKAVRMEVQKGVTAVRYSGTRFETTSYSHSALQLSRRILFVRRVLRTFDCITVRTGDHVT